MTRGRRRRTVARIATALVAIAALALAAACATVPPRVILVDVPGLNEDPAATFVIDDAAFVIERRLLEAGLPIESVERVDDLVRVSLDGGTSDDEFALARALSTIAPGAGLPVELQGLTLESADVGTDASGSWVVSLRGTREGQSVDTTLDGFPDLAAAQLRAAEIRLGTLARGTVPRRG